MQFRSVEAAPRSVNNNEDNKIKIKIKIKMVME